MLYVVKSNNRISAGRIGPPTAEGNTPTRAALRIVQELKLERGSEIQLETQANNWQQFVVNANKKVTPVGVTINPKE